VIIALALLSAFVFGGGVVLQQRVAWDVPAEHAARPGLLIRLARRPLWLLGMGADVIGFALQAAALHSGSLVVVQPLIATSLVFTLVLTAVWTKHAISSSQWAALVVVLVGLSMFLVIASPDEQSTVSVADTQGWVLCTGVILIITLVAVGAGLRATSTARAALFGVAAGIADAFMATLAKSFSGALTHGYLHVFATWTPYAVVAGGLTAILLVSTAYQAGHPTVSLPVITVLDPLVASLIGITLFGEHLMLSGARGPIVVLSLIAMAAGLVALGRDDRIAHEIAGDPSSGINRSGAGGSGGGDSRVGDHGNGILRAAP
jgi:drug/metabolite transporter (DMT)-like permease